MISFLVERDKASQGGLQGPKHGGDMKQQEGHEFFIVLEPDSQIKKQVDFLNESAKNVILYYGSNQD